ncbi:MAG TPA: 16S rRNA (adenine(1518)-N(6)/adenine(1519)-N(6))-dimethyltransferase RsmA [Candidatus Paceibacterota bacterium]|nr:16S rRNA (adenine(1518)-N(6)/adenine(1519)-N(6))-dimethyltransferase RsmA [Candidatus Paceibacterota bacterium]
MERKKRGARLGQHFLTGQWAARKLVEAAGIASDDIVLEIGPGKGALTKEILKTGARVIAIEKDPALVELLRVDLPKERLVVIGADVRDIRPGTIGLMAGAYVLAANIPYYITGEIIRQFLSTDVQPKTMALLVQREVAERILARDKKESILSISVKAYGKPEIAAKVARGNFAPPPSVDSAILVVRNISKAFFGEIDEGSFFKVVRTGFSSKRKFLAGNLAKEYGREKAARALAAAEVPEKARAEDVSLEAWRKMVESLG